ncbi:hypothetical protein HDU97_001206 [Phlyctochytrium planicorne]|nr:hypothetical protein HDU97_001206 [Phlyctochytrium planicorne]
MDKGDGEILKKKLHHVIKELIRSAKVIKIAETQKLIKKIKELKKKAEAKDVPEQVLAQREKEVAKFDGQLQSLKKVKPQDVVGQIFLQKVAALPVDEKQIIEELLPSVQIDTIPEDLKNLPGVLRLSKSKKMETAVDGQLDILRTAAIGRKPKRKREDDGDGDSQEKLGNLERKKAKKEKVDAREKQEGGVKSDEKNRVSAKDEKGAAVFEVGNGKKADSKSVPTVTPKRRVEDVSRLEEEEDDNAEDGVDDDEGGDEEEYGVLMSDDDIANSDDPDIEDDDDLDDQIDMRQPPPKKMKSAFVSSLADGDFSDISLSDDDEEIKKLVVEPEKKNRMGQRARRALWEKKYGKEAKHVQNEKAARIQRGAPAPGPKARAPRKAPMPMKTSYDGVSAPKPAKKEPKSKEPKLHPSWEAKKNNAQSIKIGAPGGKKIKFDED